MGRDIEATAEDLKLFLQEADEQLQLLDEHLVRLEKEPDNAELLQEIFRAAHTLKGSSGMLGFHEMAELTHTMEDVLDRLRKGTLTVTPQLVDALLQSLDGLRDLRESLDSEDGQAIDVQPLVAALRALAEQGVGTVSTDLPTSRTLEAAAAKLQSVRIDVDRLDTLANMVGELVIDRNRIHQIARALQSRYEEDALMTALAETSTRIVKVVDELNHSIMQVRMLPIETLFSKFPRLARDLARSSGKSVDFVVEGQETEIDRSVIERIKDPLVHLIRNAVDHGIEPPESRRECGKPEAGLVKLSARHEQGFIVMTLTDDGKGIDSGLIKGSAVRKGIISAEVAERLSDLESLDLVFAPGVSTATDTTEVSGRGVGMDIVRREIDALNGLVEIDTSLGIGTAITLRLPLTLATFRGLLVESAKTVYAIPLRHVQETARPEPGSIRTIIGRRVLNLRGKVMPLLPLHEICRTGSENGHQDSEDFVVVVKVGDRPLAVAVDALIEQQEIVMKSLGGQVGHTNGIAGASILGDGQVVLILDVPTLMKAADRGSPDSAELQRRIL